MSYPAATMAERDIRYCTTEDGVRIAYAVTGDGPLTLIYTPNLFMSVTRMEELPSRRRWLDLLNARFRVVRYDARGTGLSQREVDDVGSDTWVYDMAAVCDRAGGARFAVFGNLSGSLIALRYALRFPERVSHLMLWLAPYVDPGSGQTRALGQMAATDWQTFTENFSHISVGWEEGADARQLARSMRDSVTQQMYFRWMRGAWGQWPGQPGYRELLGEYTRIEAPTLIMQRTPSASNPAIADLAAAIPEARVRIFEGEETVPTIGNVGDVVDAMSEFVGIPGTMKSAAQAAPGKRFATILFTDLVGHTELMRKLGDERGRQLLREHERITRAALSQYGGTEIKTDGDSFMASFTSATSAVECAISLQRSFAGMPDGPLRVRMGMNAGEPVEDDGDLFGSSVILAARVKDRAGAGEILIPEPVRHLLAGKGFDFADRGEFVPKGFDEPLRLFEVRWRE